MGPKRLTQAAGAVCALVAATAPALAQSGSAEAEQPLAERTMPSEARLTEAERVTRLAGCTACHSAEAGEPYAGGRPLETPFGILNTPNITPHETGIGNWTLADFTASLREGRSKDGELLYPGMPYVNYTKMQDEDVALIFDYLRAVQPVDNAVETNQLPFPFDQRRGMAVWNFMHFEEGRFEPNPDKSEEWNRGAYISEALAHCGSCHTPRGPLGGRMDSAKLQGSQQGAWYAPNISGNADSILKDWTVERLDAFLRNASAENHVALGPMTEVVMDLSGVPEEDTRALAIYLMDQPGAVDEPARAPDLPSEDVRAAWGELYDVHCASCHGADGEGAPGVAASLVGAGGVVAAEPNNIVAVLVQGVGATDDYGIMPSFREVLSAQDIADVTNYVRTSWGNDAAANATASMVRVTLADLQIDPDLAASAMCPSALDEQLPDDLVSALEAVRVGEIAQPQVDELAARYVEVTDSATYSDAVRDLAGRFCRVLLAEDRPREEVTRSYLEFATALSLAPAFR